MTSRGARILNRQLSSVARATPHPSLTYIPNFLSSQEQRLLLAASLQVLSLPSQTTSYARRLARNWLKSHPEYDCEHGFMQDEAYEFQKAHFDGVIEGYREVLVKEGMFRHDEQLARVLQRVYSLLPGPHTATTCDPPPHLLLHLLHLSSKGAIYPHVDNLSASGGTIVGVSLGSERVVRFEETDENGVIEGDGPDRFEVLLEPGSVYVQKYTEHAYRVGVC